MKQETPEQKIAAVQHQISRTKAQISKLDEILQINQQFRDADSDPQNIVLYKTEERQYKKIRSEYQEFLQGCEEHLNKLLNH